MVKLNRQPSGYLVLYLLLIGLQFILPSQFNFAQNALELDNGNHHSEHQHHEVHASENINHDEDETCHGECPSINFSVVVSNLYSLHSLLAIEDILLWQNDYRFLGLEADIRPPKLA